MVGLTVQPIAGADLLQRRGDVVVLVSTAGDDAAVDALLDVVREAADASTDGRRLVRRLAGYLSADVIDPPAFVALAPTGEDMAVLVHGAAEARVQSAGGDSETLSGRAAATWIDRVVPWPATAITAVTSAAITDVAVPRSELYDGSVPAGGFVAVPPGADPAAVDATSADSAPVPAADLASTAEIPAEMPADAEEPTPEFESILLLPDAAAADDEPRDPLPVAGDAPVVPPDAVIVKGIQCKRNHFNAPNAAFCGVCGISMVQQTHELVDGPRPPLGVIVFDDGTAFGLDADYVIGREPENDAQVSSGQLRGLTIEDPEGSVSRVHALIKLDGWDVQIVDRDSANGTRVSAPADDSWTSLTPHAPMVIQPGTKVQLGRRTFTFDAHFHL